MSDNVLIIVNDAPYGTEAAWNALRIACALPREDEDVTVNLFLMGDAVGNAVAGQSTPDGYYNVERMLNIALRKGAKVHLCSTCMKARGIEEDDLIDLKTEDITTPLLPAYEEEILRKTGAASLEEARRALVG